MGHNDIIMTKNHSINNLADTPTEPTKEISYIEIAQEYHSYGLQAVPSKHKRPALEKWTQWQAQSISPKQLSELFDTDFDGMGFICGAISGNLEVIDLDIKELAPEQADKIWLSYVWAIKEYDHNLFNSLVIERSKSGGKHIYYKCSEIGRNTKLSYIWANDKKEGLFETRAEGGFIVADPTEGYALFQNDFSSIPLITPIQRKFLLDLARSYDQTTPKDHHPEKLTTTIHNQKDVFTLCEWLMERHNKSFFINGNKSNFRFSLALWLRSYGVSFAEAENYILSNYPSQAPNPQRAKEDVKSAYSDKYAKHEGKYTYNPKTKASTVRTSTNQEPPAHSTEEGEKTINKKKKSLQHSHEAPELLDEIIALISSKDAKELDVLLRQLNKEKPINIAESYLTKSYVIRNNIIANRFEYSKPPEVDFRELNPDEINREFQKKSIKFPLGAIKSLLKSDFVPEYNPFIDYFKGLPAWAEKDKDYITELAKHISTSDNKRFVYHFKKFLVRAVACAIDTEVVNKQCLVLVSPQQNNGKSTFCRFLVPPKLSEYIAENIGTDKDSLIALCQNLFINLDELSTLNKTEINALKSVFSKDVVKVRKPYDANPTSAPRVASFIGSTNRDEFLSDETGSVRWLCFDILNIDFAYSKLNIDLVYAQAYALYKNGFEYQMTKLDVEENEEVNKKFKVTSTEKELLVQNFRPVSNEEYEAYKGTEGYDALPMTDILDELQGERKNTLRSHLLTQALKDLGFNKKSIRKGNGNPYKAYLLQRISSLSTNDVEDSQ